MAITLGEAADAAAIIGSITTLVGVGIATYVAVVQIRDIRGDQKRIASELAAKPKLKIGFIDPFVISSRATPKKTWMASPAQPDTELKGFRKVPIQILIRNIGNRTARDLLINVGVPRRILFPPIEKGGSLHLSDRTNVLATNNEKPLNPGDNRGLQLYILVPDNIYQVQVDVAVSMRDQKDRKATLSLNIPKSE